jgi:hypothetical protein
MPKPIFGGSDSTSSNNSSGINAGQNANLGFGINGNYGINESQNFNTGQSQSAGGSQSSGNSFNQSNQNVYGDQAPYLQDVYAQGQNAFSQGLSEVNGIKSMVQGSMGGALGSAQAGYGNQIDGGFAQSLAGQVGPNAYVNAMKGQIADDAQLLKQQNLGGLDARAAAAGMSGSSGYRDQVNDMSNQIDKSALNQMSQIGYDAHDSGIRNQMELAGMLDSSQQFGVDNMNAIQQGAMNMFNPSMIGQDMAANYAQTIGGPTTLTNSLGGSQNSANSFNQANSQNFGGGFSNGFNAGLGVNGNMGWGNNYGSNTGSGSGMTDTHTGFVPGLAALAAARQ